MAKLRGFDGIICGHLHFPAIRRLEGVLYCNDGDWVENCSALIETDTGDLRLIRAESSSEAPRDLIFVDATAEVIRASAPP